MIPENITKNHIIEAINYINNNDIEYAHATSSVWDLIYGEKSYSPKHTIAIANEIANNQFLEYKDFTTDTARKFLQKMGDEFQIVKKDDDPVKELVENYKDHLIRNRLKDELYKWELIAEYRGRPHLGAPDFDQEIRSINYKNLIFHSGFGVRNRLGKNKPEEYRDAFKILFDERITLENRISEFGRVISSIYSALGTANQHHHDERTMSAFLTFYNPEKYALYKNSFYRKFCDLLNEWPAKMGNKYPHYLSLLKAFIQKYIDTDEELLKIYKQILPGNVYQDTNHHLLAQDILYTMLDRGKITFTDIIEDLKQNLLEDVSVLSTFSFAEISDHGLAPKPKKHTYVWISDTDKIIGREEAHYEISIRTRNGKVNHLFVDLHFEGANQYKYKQSTVILPDQCEWFNWMGGFSIGFKEGISTDDPDLPGKIKEQLIYLETTVGDRIRTILLNKNENEIYVNNSMNMSLNQILYGPPGTGKTFATIDRAIAIINPDFYDEVKQMAGTEPEKRSALTREFRKLLIKDWDNDIDGQIVFTTFHQNMSYEDFIEGIKPETIDQQVTYKIEDGIFKRLCAKAVERRALTKFDDSYSQFVEDVENKGFIELVTPVHKKRFHVSIAMNETSVVTPQNDNSSDKEVTKTMVRKYMEDNEIIDWKSYTVPIGEYIKMNFEKVIDNSKKKFVLIIDEINRGNVSSIFGELITLIEKSKRYGGTEELEVILPYSKEPFFVPDNVYIIGTMNTADRSVEALDTALRRRFIFSEMMPDSRLLEDSFVELSDGHIHLKVLLELINKRLVILLDKDHQIGHAYFMGIKTLADLNQVFENSIIPLLQEYFYGDFGKIGLVLGNSFVEKHHHDLASFANFQDYDPSRIDSFIDRYTYVIRPKNEWDFKSI
ncbi:5-methylcytosine-specific restriction protein B [Pedobacter cryoconitis]|uniref:McrB family protein n=1 Tax=Pedobacter cryoconitis TaxID=188932 RepID=UPI0017AEE678|nr:AAA family ATPase [Pedobacter cryoconitis]MBB6271663.1 5-methylcytosine-specific restriction protein B [Pedobacter cryoconitis]